MMAVNLAQTHHIGQTVATGSWPSNKRADNLVSCFFHLPISHPSLLVHPSSRRGQRTCFPIQQCSNTPRASDTLRTDIHSSLESDLTSPHLSVPRKLAQDCLLLRGL